MQSLIKLLFAALVSIVLASCQKEDATPRLRFTDAERKWFVYEPGQVFTFKNASGDSIVYTVTNVEYNENVPEYADTSRTVIVAYSESYSARLSAGTDWIAINFYKEWLHGAHPEQMRETILWPKFDSQLVQLDALENHTPFFSRTVNGKTYTRVTKALPFTQSINPLTQFANAYYDQESGFIEILDLNGVSWKRE